MARRKGQSLGGRYRAQPVDPVTGRRLNLRAESLSELESRLSRVRHARDGLRFGDISARQAQGMLRPAVGFDLSVATLADRYIRGVPAPSERVYRSTWKNLLAPWFGSLVVWDLDESRLRAWKTDLTRARRPGGKRGYSPKTIRHAWDFLKGMVKLAVRDGNLSDIPWGSFSVPNPKRPERERDSCRDPAELLRLLDAAKAFDVARGRRSEGRLPVICFLALTGLRQAEAAGLSWDEIDFDRDPPEMRIRKQAIRGWPRIEGGDRPQSKPKKGGIGTQILHADAVAVLKYQRHVLKTRGLYRDDGPVFPRPGTARFRTSGRVITARAFRDTVKRAGLPSPENWDPHSLRHSFSRLELLGHGGDLRTVAARTRHADLEVLQGYLRKPSREEGGSKIPALPPGLAVPALEARADVAVLPAGSLEIDAPETAIPGGFFSWVDIGRAWLRDGAPGKRPKPVTEGIKAAYARAYNAELRASGNAVLAGKAGLRARRGAAGAWSRVLAGLQAECVG